MSEPIVMMSDRTAVAQAVARVEVEYGMDVVAVVSEADGTVWDYVFNFDTGIHYANQGYRVTALKPEGVATVAVMQAAFDDELAIAVDCFGSDRVK